MTWFSKSRGASSAQLEDIPNPRKVAIIELPSVVGGTQEATYQHLGNTQPSTVEKISLPTTTSLAWPRVQAEPEHAYLLSKPGIRLSREKRVM